MSLLYTHSTESPAAVLNCRIATPKTVPIPIVRNSKSEEEKGPPALDKTICVQSELI